jgi:hypothetical protein
MVDSVNNGPGAYNLLPSSFFDPKTNALLVDEATAQQVQAGIQAKLDSLPPIGDEAFLQMVADLVPGDVDTPQKLQATLDNFEAAAAQLKDASSEVITFVGDISKLLARMMIEQTGQQRQNALNDRLAAREQAKGELMSQADQMDKAADKMIEGANTALVTAIISAVVQIAGATIAIAGSAFNLRAMGNAANKDAFDIANGYTQVFQAANAIGTAGGQGINAGGTSTDTKAQAEAKKLEAQGSRDAAEAQEAQQQADSKKQMEEALNDMIKQIINFLKELREAEVDAMRALTKV